MPERTLTVKIIGDDRSLQQAFKRSERAGTGLQAKVSGVGPAIAKGFLAAGAGVLTVQGAFKVLGDSVDQASAINEEIAKSQQIFGESSAAIVSWSSTTAKAIGISKREALEATGIFGNLFATVGLAPQASADMSRSLVQLAADVASFNNANPSDVLEAIRSGLIGEAEPLRRYGVLLSETRVQQKAMADTGKTNVASLTNQEKALARYEIILHDTGKAQGDVGRTGGGLANQQRKLAAQTADLEAELGKGLVPILTLTVTGLNETIGATLGLTDAFEGLRNRLRHSDWADGFNQAVDDANQGVIGFLKNIRDTIPEMDKLLALRERLRNIGDRPTPPQVAGLQPGQLPGLPPLPGSPILPPVAVPKPKAAPDPFGPLKEQDARRRRQALEANREHRRAQRAFDAFVAGMGLKLDNAAITATLSDDLAALRQLEAAILKRIAAEGRTFKLAQALSDVRSRIATTTAEQAADAKQKSSDAFDKIIDSLNLDLERAQATRGLDDDLASLRAIEAAILKRIRAEGRTTELLRQLFENRQAQAQTLRDQRDAAQFEALGLTAEGEKRGPSRGALLKRARSLEQQLKGTVLDTPATKRKLDQIIRVLTNTTKSTSRRIRGAILDMLNEISQPLGADTGGALTKFAKRGANDLIKGLGLDTNQIKEIRSRFSQLGRLDFEPTPRRPRGRTATPLPGDRGPGAEPGRVTVNVYIDGQKIEGVVTRRQQKKRGRNAPQRRGVRPGA